MFKKKILLILMILLVNFNIVYADENDYEEIDMENINTIDVAADLKDEPNINSRAAIIFNRDSKEIMWGKNENVKRKMASTTKIMTATIVLENCNLTDTVTISKKSAVAGGSRLGLKVNDKISVNDLLYGLLLVSGNDAAVALAEYTAGSVENFAVMMNEKAKFLKLKDTNFVTPHGLDSEEHYTTAYELALITDYALQNNKFAQMVNTKNYTININGYPKALSNTNELLGNLNGVNGVKTGFTNGANRCLVTSVKRGNMNIITVVLGADTKKFRTTDSMKLIEYAYGNFKNVPIKNVIEQEYRKWEADYEKSIILNKGVNEYIDTVLEKYDKEYMTIKNAEENDINIKIESEEYIEAPVEENQIVGKMVIYVKNQEKLTLNIVNKRYIKKMNMLDYYKNLFIKNWQTMCEI